MLDVRSMSVLTTGDRHLWTQVFNNLLENCLRYASESPRVIVKLATTRSHAMIAVQDQGPGAPERTIAQLTERLFRGDAHREVGGTGLGLALVAAICRIHEATVDFANEGGLKVTPRIPRNWRSQLVACRPQRYRLRHFG